LAGIAIKGKKGFQPKDVKKRRKEAARFHSFSDEIKNDRDIFDVTSHVLEKAGLKDPNVKADEFGFTDDFYKFLGIDKNNGRDYRIPLDEVLEKHGQLTTDYASYYTPLDDFYGTPGGGDTVYDKGRIPVSHLVELCSKRLGVAFRGCNSVANDVFRNRFVFVDYDNPEKVIKRPDILKWMRLTDFWGRMVETLDFERRTGLGHLIAYYPGDNSVKNLSKKAPTSRLKNDLSVRPDDFETFSCYFMTPNNLFDSARLDYNKKKWNFTGGLFSATDIHHSRVYVLETRRVEGGLRGLAIPELCWVPLICYLNTCYYILRSLSQLGTVVVGANISHEYPTTDIAEKYLEVLGKMRANKFFLFGKNTDFKIVNAAAKIGEGITGYMEFLKEDISSAWIIPKNQLFGRADGGGLEGAGALVSKEDYLSSCLSTLQLHLTPDIMMILENMCGFSDLENVTLRWNLDLHKTEQQRLTEELMRQQLEQAKVQTKMIKIQHKLMKIQLEQAKMQFKEFEKQPKLLLPEQQKSPVEKQVDEDKKISPKKSTKIETEQDFVDAMQDIKRMINQKHLYKLQQQGINLHDTWQDFDMKINWLEQKINKQWREIRKSPYFLYKEKTLEN